jgi:hypothetical protein
LFLLQVAAISPTHSPHSYFNTHHKSKSHSGITLNVKKLGGHSLPFSHLRQLVVFALVFFFNHPIPFMMASFLYVHMEAIIIGSDAF